ncbi:MAG: hypothetical protein JWM44_3885, partial [Bacilli bacterium]|nr:hypothetical protein [Bacilli bacterium]
MLGKIKIMVAFVFIMFGLFLTCSAAFAYTNPMTLPNENPNDGIGDPFVMKYNGTFYLYTSTGQ